MAYDETLDARITEYMTTWDATRKKMFGGTCHLIRGNMACGVYKDSLILRLGEERASTALQQPHIAPFDVTGRPMKGWVMVEPAGYRGDLLWPWLDQARAFAETLPQK